jgi:PAS domain S-box-containing protein
MTASEVSPDWSPALLAVSLDGQFVLRPRHGFADDYEVLFANEAGAKFLDAKPDEMLGRFLSDFLPPTGTGLRDSLAEALRTGEPQYRLTSQTAPGSGYQQIEYRLWPFDGLIAVSVVDRSTQYEATQQVQLLRRVLRDGLAASPFASALLMPVIDDDGNVIDAVIEQANAGSGPAVAARSGRLTGQRISDVVGLDLDLFVPMMRRALEGQIVVEELPGAPLGTSSDRISVRLAPVKPFLLLFAADVTKERQREAMLSAIVERAAEMIAFSDADGILRYVNPYTVEQLGIPEAELLGSSILNLSVPEDRPHVMDEMITLRDKDGAPARRRIRLVDNAGGRRTLLGSTVMLKNAAGRVDGFVTVAADLTDRLANEEAREQLAAELAVAEQHERDRLAEELHDGPVQNLTALSLLLGSALQHEPNPHLSRAEDMVVSTIADLRSLMFQLSTPELSGDRLSQHIRQRAERLFEGSPIKLQMDLELHTPPTAAVSIALFRLAQEALVNALKHSQASTVWVKLDDDPISNSIVLDIRDDGIGAMTSAYLRHRPGHFGVSMMIDRAQQLGGTFSIHGEIGEGTVVRVVLPRGIDPGSERLHD